MAEKLILERKELDQLAALVDDGGGITEIPTFASADAFLDYIRNLCYSIIYLRNDCFQQNI